MREKTASKWKCRPKPSASTKRSREGRRPSVGGTSTHVREDTVGWDAKCRPKPSASTKRSREGRRPSVGGTSTHGAGRHGRLGRSGPRHLTERSSAGDCGGQGNGRRCQREGGGRKKVGSL